MSIPQYLGLEMYTEKRLTKVNMKDVMSKAFQCNKPRVFSNCVLHLQPLQIKCAYLLRYYV